MMMRTELERRVTERTAALIESETKYRQLADQHQTLALVSPGLDRIGPELLHFRAVLRKNVGLPLVVRDVVRVT
jgi:hypothetical protein